MALGFTRLSKGLSVVLLLGYLVVLLLPWTVDYLALVPARTIPFAWNILTAGYVEQSIFGLIVSILGLLYSGKLLEPVWTPREFLKFVVFVNTFTLAGVYVSAVALYYATRKEVFIYIPLSGFYGVLSGFLVGVKQVLPDQEIMKLGSFYMKAEWLPSIFVFMSIIISCVTTKAMPYLPFVIFGTYGGWLYIRYFQRDPDVNLTGYPVSEFAFATFFPPFMRPLIDILASGLHKLFCGSQASKRGDEYSTDSSSVPGLDTPETSRWRERGARALEAKLKDAVDEDTKMEHVTSVV